MKLDSKYFDKIRVRRGAEKPERRQAPPCDWPGCAKPGAHRAPKGRGMEGQFYNYCLDHVQQYNKTYNFFEGMADDAIAGWHKESITGHRPTWKLGENSWASQNGARRNGKRANRDPFGF